MGTVTANPTPRSRSSGGGPLSAQWTDASRVALVGPGDVAVPVGIDTYTWAELQTAYPNNGAALLALAANTMVFVSDWQALFVRSADGSRWNNVGSFVLGSLASVVVVNAGTTEQTLFSCAVPAGLMGPKSGLRWAMGLRAGANTSSMTIRFRYDSTQIDSNALTSTNAFSGMSQLRNVGAPNANAYCWQSGLFVSGALALDTAAAWTFSITAQPGTSGDSVTARLAYLELV